MLECSEITKKYGRKTVVDAFSAKFEPGKVYAVLGPNGSGKTTLMKMIEGLVVPNKGSITFDGHDAGYADRAAIAYMPTEAYFYGYMTPETAGRFYADFYEDFSVLDYENRLKKMGIEPYAKIRTLSSGQAAKMKIALTLSRKAKVYMLDEPLNGIDLISRDEIIREIIAASDDDTVMIISTHIIEEIEGIIDHVIFLKDGKKADEGNVEENRSKTGKSITAMYREIYGVRGESEPEASNEAAEPEETEEPEEEGGEVK